MQERRWLLLWLWLALLLSLAACGQPATTPGTATPCPAPPDNSTPAVPPAFRLLVFSRTAAFRHDSIPAASAALQRLAAEHQASIDFTENPTCFTQLALEGVPYQKPKHTEKAAGSPRSLVGGGMPPSLRLTSERFWYILFL